MVCFLFFCVYLGENVYHNLNVNNPHLVDSTLYRCYKKKRIDAFAAFSVLRLV